MARLKVILAIILLVGLGQCARNLIKCVVCKKTLTWSQQKQSRLASTYHEILSNFISPLDLDNSARVCSACRIALTSAKSKRSAETFVDVSRHFKFPLFWNGKGTQILKKYIIANFSEWVRRAHKPGAQKSQKYNHNGKWKRHPTQALKQQRRHYRCLHGKWTTQALGRF